MQAPDLAVDLASGGGSERERTAPVLPSAPSASDDVLRAGSFEAFDAVAVNGCVRPLPSSLAVEPTVPMGRMIEHAWTTLPASTRTGPAATCTLRASTGKDEHGRDVMNGHLACSDLRDSVSSVPIGRDLDTAAPNLASELVNTLAFDACKLTHR